MKLMMEWSLLARKIQISWILTIREDEVDIPPEEQDLPGKWKVSIKISLKNLFMRKKQNGEKKKNALKKMQWYKTFISQVNTITSTIQKKEQ